MPLRRYAFAPFLLRLHAFSPHAFNKVFVIDEK
jgi:hypothetical protein